MDSTWMASRGIPALDIVPLRLAEKVGVLQKAKIATHRPRIGYFACNRADMVCKPGRVCEASCRTHQHIIHPAKEQIVGEIVPFDNVPEVDGREQPVKI